MYSKHHALCSLVVGAGAIAVLEPIAAFGVDVPAAVLLGYAVAAGVLIDLDHFLVARARTGTWDAVRFCLRNPTAVFVDQGRIFSPGDVGVLHRLLSHHLLAGPFVALLALESVPLAAFTAVVLYAHVVCDLVWDVLRLDPGAERPAPERSKTES